MKLQAITFIGILSLAVACRDDEMGPAAPEFTQNYTLTYNVTTNQTEAQASFAYTEGSYSRTCLPANHSITCNTTVCPEYVNSSATPSGPGQGWPCYYKTTFTGLVDLHFEFKKSSGETFINNLLSDSIPLVDFDTAFTTLSLSDTVRIPFSGGAALAGQYVSISIVQAPPHVGAALAVTGDSVVTITPADLSNLAAGSAILYITRQLPNSALAQADGPNGQKMVRVMAQRTITLVN